MKIAVIGTGYVGLVVGTCFAETGNRVTCVDVDEDKIAMLEERGEGPDLRARPRGADRSATLRRAPPGHFTTETSPRSKTTPPSSSRSARRRTKTAPPTCKYVLAVAASIGKHMTDYQAWSSTKSHGAGRDLTPRACRDRQATRSTPFDVVSNPEFLKEGAAIDDFMKPDRVVIGADEPRARRAHEGALLALRAHRQADLLVMDPESRPRLCKYASNAMLATRISFMNEIARICELVGADIGRVREGHRHRQSRIGIPSCSPAPATAARASRRTCARSCKTANEHGYEPKVVKAVEEVNESAEALSLREGHQALRGDLAGKHFAMWGLSFKPKTDDMREAPSPDSDRQASRTRRHRHGQFDPEAIREAQRILGDKIRYAKKPLDAAKDADALLLVTEWSEFRHPDFEDLKATLKQPIIFDGRNIFPRKKLRDLGFTYYGIGVDRE
jgi:UDPglucose 6-dehydrogenase